MILPWIAFALMAGSLAAAVVTRGGVYPQQWVWSALGVSLAATLLLTRKAEKDRSSKDFVSLPLLSALLAWMALQIVPLPPTVVAWLSPERWTAAKAARDTTGLDLNRWLALSVAPMATIARLLAVVPVMASFVAARELAWIWRHRLWTVVAPIICVAWFESLLALGQFYLMRTRGGEALSATGTYVNRNHFAGLIEMVFPVVALWAVGVWRKGTDRRAGHTERAVVVAMLVGIAACLVAAIIVSLSRMAFLATLLSGCLTALALIACHLRRGRMGAPAWRLGASALLVVLALILLPTKEMADRFVGSAAADNVSTQTRLDIWKDTLPMVGAYKWVGSGLGAYEVGLFPFKTVAPTNRIDFAHNDYLQILAELGAFGAALAFALAMWILWRALRAVLQGGAIRHWELAVGLLWALFAIGLHSFADFNLYIPANAFVLAWLSGVAASPALMERGPRIAF